MNRLLKLVYKIKKLGVLFNYFFNADWIWRAPSQCDVLIYDQVGSEAIKLLFDPKYKIGIVPIRGESFNIRVLINSWQMILLRKKSIILSYVCSYIKYTKPKLVITFIDNSRRFYMISEEIAGIKTAFFQNGTRGADIFEYIKLDYRYSVDFMFVHGVDIGKLYSNYINGKVIPVGSLRNNIMDKPLNRSAKKDVAFISQWAPPTKDAFFIKTKGQRISHEKFYLAESIVLSFLSEWCEKNEYELVIVGRQKFDGDNAREHTFYRSIIKGSFVFLSPNNDSNSYQMLEQFSVVAFIDSTLGYESLARGLKAAAFRIRGSLLDINGASSGRGFGWPGRYEDTGLFWTNRPDLAHFKKIMDYLCDVSDREWSSICSHTIKDIMSYDPDNKIIKEHLRQILE